MTSRSITSDTQQNCFLSEFYRLPNFNWGVVLACLTFGGAILTLVLGHLSHANALSVEITPVLAGRTYGLISTATWWKGYLADLNHGLLYLFLAPACYLLLWRFLKQADSGIHALQNTRVLPANATQLISESNRMWFQLLGIPWLAILIAVGIGYNWYTESSSMTSTAVTQGTSKCVGYTQRVQFDNFRKTFAAQSLREQLRMIENLALYNDVKGNIGRVVLNDPKLTADWSVALRSESGTLSGEDAWLRHHSGQPVYLDLETAADQVPPLFVLDLKVNSTPLSAREAVIHHWFVVSLVALEGTLHGFGVWTLMKVLFWFWTVYRLLPTDSAEPRTSWLSTVSAALSTRFGQPNKSKNKMEPEIKMEPDFKDRESAYGMKPLHASYNSILDLLILVGCAALAQWINNRNSGLIQFTEYSSQLVTAVSLLSSVAIVVIAVVVGPIALFDHRMSKLKQRKLTELTQGLASLDRSSLSRGGGVRAKQSEELEKELSQLESQKSWPAEDKHFIGALVLALYLLVAPFALRFLEYKDVPYMAEVTRVVSFHDMTKSLAVGLCERFYGAELPYKRTAEFHHASTGLRLKCSAEFNRLTLLPQKSESNAQSPQPVTDFPEELRLKIE